MKIRVEPKIVGWTYYYIKYVKL